MATVTPDEKAFVDEFLDRMRQFVADYYNIADVYSQKQIVQWLEDNAKDYGYVMED